MSPLEKLDIVLLCLEKHHSERHHNFISIAGILQEEHPEIDFGEIQSALNKLVKDGYVEIREVGRESITDIYYMITFEGRIWKEQGGYQCEKKENDRINALADAQQEASVRMVLLTRIVAIGTSVAAIYYLLEVVKYFLHRS